MSSSFFSLVMPAYNCEKTIGRTIESILGQDFGDFELIIINDGSTDDTEGVIAAYAASDSRIRYKTIPNGGPGNARNVGIHEAGGRYLCLIDADDELDPANLSLRRSLLGDGEADLVVGSFETFVMDGEELVDKRQTIAPELFLQSHDAFLEQLYPLMDQQLMYVIWNKIYRLDIIREHKIQFPPYNSCEDRLFNLAYFRHVTNCRVTSRILYHYSFDGKNSLTNKYFANKFDTFEEFYLRTVELAPQDVSGFSALFLKGTMSCIIPLHSSGCPLSGKEKRQYIRRIDSNPNVRKAAQVSLSDSLLRKGMKPIFSLHAVPLYYLASYLMYRVSMLSPRTIEKLKGNF